MTRLREALDRAAAARSTDVPPPILPSADGMREELPRAWRFDEEESPAHAAFNESITLAEPSEVTSENASQYQFAADMAGKVVVGAGADTAVVEEFRRLAAALHHAQMERGVRSVMVASAAAAEGKTLISTNLALTLSHSYQRRVLLIDADLRRPNIHDVFGLSNRVGLGDGLKHPEVGRLPVRRISPTLWVLTAGRPDPDPMSGLVSNTMKQLIAEATSQFHWVVLDTPPLALMPDANLLAAMTDSALLVVGANSTPYPLVKRAIDSIGMPRILGVVLNKVKKSNLAGGDGYYYRYGRYQSRDDERQRPGFPLFGNRDH